MKKIIVGSLVGAASLLASVEGLAASASVTKSFSSIEKNAADAATNAAISHTLNAITVTPGSTGYLDGDVVRVSFTGGTARASSFGSTGATPTVINCRDSANNIVFTLTLTSATGSGATYSVARLITSTAPTSTTCVLSGIDILKSSLTSASQVRFNWSAESSSGAVHDVLRLADAVGNPASTLVTHVAASQFSLNASTANTSLIHSSQLGWVETRKVSLTTNSLNVVSPNRALVTTDNTFSTSATMSFTANTQGTSSSISTAGIRGSSTVAAADYLSTANMDLEITYTGDFSFLDNNGNGCSATDLTSGWARVSTNGRAITIAPDCKSMTTTGGVATTGTNTTETLTFSVYNTGDDAFGSRIYTPGELAARSIPAQTVAVSAKYILADATTYTRTSSQTWSVNAWTSSIPYMPYGSGISRIVYITNRSSDANIFFSAVDEAGTACARSRFPALVAKSGVTTSASAAIDAGIAACYGAGWTGKVVINVTAEGVAPQGGDTLIAGVTQGYSSTTDTNAATVGYTTVDPTAISGSTSGSSGSIGGAAFLTTSNGQIRRSSSNIDIYSAYNVNGNRVQVINPSNGR